MLFYGHLALYRPKPKFSMMFFCNKLNVFKVTQCLFSTIDLIYEKLTMPKMNYYLCNAKKAAYKWLRTNRRTFL